MITWHDVIPALISALGASLVGLLVWLNGHAANKTSASSALVTNAMSLVEGLNKEVTRLTETNNRLQEQLNTLTKENQLLRRIVNRMEIRVTSLEGKYPGIKQEMDAAARDERNEGDEEGTASNHS